MAAKFNIVEERKVFNLTKIKVIGVGGAGCNAINNMINAELQGVDFIVANTDAQDLERSLAESKIQLGPDLTMGLGAGGDPEIGMKAAEESADQIREYLGEPDMVFITAGMGGGTGTGASPVIARVCKETKALTVAVVTKPFLFEGEKRMKRALQGIELLRKEVDSLILINNEKLKSIGTKSMSFVELLAKADNVLLDAVKGISDLITSQGFINLDFADVKKVMEKRGTALMGRGVASGDKRAIEAAEMAIKSPLLEDISISSAKGLLINITGPSTISMEEIDAACNFLKNQVNENDVDIYWGVVIDDRIEDEIQVTVIATGIDGAEEVEEEFEDKDEKEQSHVTQRANVVNIKDKIRDATPEEIKEPWTVRKVTPPTSQKAKEGLKNEHENGKGKKRGLINKIKNLDYPAFLRNSDSRIKEK